jgi:HEPN domain-containing protein
MQKKAMQKLSDQWLTKAKSDLDSAKVMYANKTFDWAIFILQQACEKASKAYLMRMNFLPGDELNELKKESAKAVGIPRLTPAMYGHKWHKKLMDVLEEYLNYFTGEIALINESFPNSKVNSFTEGFVKTTPDYRDKIAKAKKIEENIKPTLKELDSVILSCNNTLAEATKAKEKTTKLIEQNMPSKESIMELAQSVAKTLKKEMNKEVVESIDKICGSETIDMMVETVVDAHKLIVLAILNAYLVPHEQNSRYPNKLNIKYCSNLPLVQKFNDFSCLIDKCIKLDISN